LSWPRRRFAYYIAATFAAWRFFSRERARVFPPYTPAASLLKPVHGVDFASYEKLHQLLHAGLPGRVRKFFLVSAIRGFPQFH